MPTKIASICSFPVQPPSSSSTGRCSNEPEHQLNQRPKPLAFALQPSKNTVVTQAPEFHFRALSGEEWAPFHRRRRHGRLTWGSVKPRRVSRPLSVSRILPVASHPFLPPLPTSHPFPPLQKDGLFSSPAPDAIFLESVKNLVRSPYEPKARVADGCKDLPRIEHSESLVSALV